jgi:hypothetical protein
MNKKYSILIAVIALFAIAATAFVIIPKTQRNTVIPTQDVTIDTSIPETPVENPGEPNTVIDLVKKAIPTKVVNPSAKNLSAWLWDAPDTFTKAQLDKMFTIAKTEKITMIYVRMDDYIDIYSIKDAKVKA